MRHASLSITAGLALACLLASLAMPAHSQGGKDGMSANSASPTENPAAKASPDTNIAIQRDTFSVTFAGGTTKSGGRLKVRIAGPDGETVYESTSNAGILDWVLDTNLPDGRYRWDA